MGSGDGSLVLRSSIHYPQRRTAYKPSARTMMGPFCSGGRTESIGSLMDKPTRIHCKALRLSSAHTKCSEIEMVVCGSVQKSGGSFTCTGEGRIRFCRSMDFLAMQLPPSLRIVKAVFGYVQRAVSTAFATLPSAHLL